MSKVDLLPLVTRERMSSYLAATGDDLDQAFALYDWNAKAATEVLLFTGVTEVVVRNALYRALTDMATSRGWSTWLHAAPLDRRGRTDIDKARSRATRSGRVREVHGKVVAELSFGFWRYLTSTRYLTTLWTPALYAAFPGGPFDKRELRSEVDRRLANLLLVRNRAAHHEPIHRRDLLRDLDSAIELMEWVAPAAGEWLTEMTTVTRMLLSARPGLRTSVGPSDTVGRSTTTGS